MTNAGCEGRFEHFEHDADIGVRGFGPTQAAAFAQAARTLTAVAADLDAIAAHEMVAIACEAPDAEVLLVDFLNAVIYAMATGALLFRSFEVTIEGGRLRALAWGERIDPGRHALCVEVKGATFTALRVARQPDGQWLAQCVVDV